MSKLTDLIAVNSSVSFNGHVINVKGLSLNDLVALFVKYPELSGELMKINGDNYAQELLKRLPKVGVAIVSAGIVGEPEATPEEVELLPFGLQFDLFYKIMKLTVPGGFGPFAEKLAELAKATNGE